MLASAFFGGSEGEEIEACLPEMDVVGATRSLWRWLTVFFLGLVVFPETHRADIVYTAVIDREVSTARASVFSLCHTRFILRDRYFSNGLPPKS